MKDYLDEYNYVVIWKYGHIKKCRAYFAIKENAIDLGRYLLRRGFQVKVKKLNHESNKS
ncbi:MAG: hypothetical protein IKA99_02570 [Clostridia bacterium]|nr:hypothetical protein [Clostridia bacterium]